MATFSKRTVNSYNTYLKERAKWSAKGYGLDRELTIDEYAYAHEAIVRKEHTKHPARDIASLDRTFTRAESAGYIRRLKTATRYEDVDEEAIKALQKKYKKSIDIYSQELTPEEARANEEMRKARIREIGKEPEHIIQSNARSRLFNELRDAGLSYKDAEKVLYGE